MLNAAQLDQFHELGFVVIDGFASELFDPLRKATDRVIKRTRAGTWAARKCPNGDVWGVSGLLDPKLEEPIFAMYMATPHVIDVSADLLGDRNLRLSLTNLLCNPQVSDYAIAWHRDSGNPRDSGEKELRHLNQMQYGVQWNGALYEESCLRVVPKTHRRNLNAAERDVLHNRPMDPMPGELIVKLRAGETVYYNANLLHRGVYPCGTRRETLHANLVSMKSPVPFKLHYEAVKFMEVPGFKNTIPAALHPLLDNWLLFAKQFQFDEVIA